MGLSALQIGDRKMMSPFHRDELHECERKIAQHVPGVIDKKLYELRFILYEYCKRGEVSCVALILKTFADRCIDDNDNQEFMNSRDDLGYTAMHYAAMSCAPECIELLLKAGASKDIMNESGTESPYDVINKKRVRITDISNAADKVAECKRLLLIPSNPQPDQ
jgi:hypothetical protein